MSRETLNNAQYSNTGTVTFVNTSVTASEDVYNFSPRFNLYSLIGLGERYYLRRKSNKTSESISYLLNEIIIAARK